MNCAICKKELIKYQYLSGDEQTKILNGKDFVNSILNISYPVIWDEVLIEKIKSVRSEYDMIYGHDCHKCGRRRCNGLCMQASPPIGQVYGIIEHKICSINCMKKYWIIKNKQIA